MRVLDVRDTPHAFEENKSFVVLLLANTQCEGVLKSFWSGVSKQPGLTAVPQQGQAKLIFKGNTCTASECGCNTDSPGGIHLLNEYKGSPSFLRSLNKPGIS